VATAAIPVAAKDAKAAIQLGHPERSLPRRTRRLRQPSKSLVADVESEDAAIALVEEVQLPV
jgi:hypothetical protein